MHYIRSAIRKVLVPILFGALLTFSNCDFGIGDDMDLGLGNMWPYLYYDFPDSLYNHAADRSHIHINPDSVDFHGYSSATLYFSAFADTSMVIDLINGGLDDMENVEERIYNRKIDTHIVNINTDDCLQDISIKSDSISFVMEKGDVYNFCFVMDQLERNSFYFLYGYFYHHILSNKQAQMDSTEFYFEFITPN